MRYFWRLLVVAGVVGISAACARPKERLFEIVYVASGELRCVTPDGTRSRAVSTGYEYSDPAWNVAGTEIATEQGVHDGPHHLVVFTDRGSLLRRLPQSSEAFRPAWDHAGRIYAITYTKPAQLMRWTGARREVLPIVGPVEQPQSLSFSPSGTRLAILDSFAAIAVARVVGNKVMVERRLDLGAPYVAQNAWLDETTMVFVRKMREGEPSDLGMVNTRTGQVSGVKTAGIYLRDFVALSPDRRLAVVCATPADGELRWSLWVASLAGDRSAKRITSGLEDVEPTWRSRPN